MLGLLLFGLVGPGTGQAQADPEAASGTAAVAEPAPDLPDPVGETLTTTLFLPMIGRRVGAVTNLWYAAYYDNAYLAGAPVYTAQERRVDYNWGEGSPLTSLPADRFSIRWSGEWKFEVGEYTFFTYADDGVRLWLDGELVIDAWQIGFGQHQATRTIWTEGVHSLTLEYYEWTSAAAINLGWRRTDIYPEWEGTYYNNPWVESPKAYSQTDTAIEFDWGEGCPDGLLNCDSFSIGWTARPVLEAGTHRIYLYADDGYQLYADGNLIKEGGWYAGQDGGGQDVSVDVTAPTTDFRTLRFNFHDGGSLAEARLLIQKRGEPYWTAEYYDNRTLNGAPVRIKDEEVVFADWGLDKPIGALPSGDSFSIRYTGQRYFHAGCFRFGLFVDDGVRLWVDGELLVDEWHDARAEYFSPYTYLTTGYHDVKIEYYEHSGEAELRFWWE